MLPLVESFSIESLLVEPLLVKLWLIELKLRGAGFCCRIYGSEGRCEGKP